VSVDDRGVGYRIEASCWGQCCNHSIKCTFWMLELSKDCPLIVKCDRKGVGVVVCGWCRTKDGSVVLDCVEFVGWDLDAGSCDRR
jgi:hypothetical protein